MTTSMSRYSLASSMDESKEKLDHIIKRRVDEHDLEMQWAGDQAAQAEWCKASTNDEDAKKLLDWMIVFLPLGVHPTTAIQAYLRIKFPPKSAGEDNG